MAWCTLKPDICTAGLAQPGESRAEPVLHQDHRGVQGRVKGRQEVTRARTGTAAAPCLWEVPRPAPCHQLPIPCPGLGVSPLGRLPNILSTWSPPQPPHSSNAFTSPWGYGNPQFPCLPVQALHFQPALSCHSHRHNLPCHFPEGYPPWPPFPGAALLASWFPSTSCLRDAKLSPCRPWLLGRGTWHSP